MKVLQNLWMIVCVDGGTGLLWLFATEIYGGLTRSKSSFLLFPC